MTRTRKTLFAIAAMVLLAALALPAMLYWRARRALPEYDGELALSGLHRPVRVVRDAMGVPHIYAENIEDLVFAQGFIQAQERMWQMDMLRRTARGRLAEVVGEAALPIDRENRILGLGRTADRVAELLGEDERRLLESYSAGVNAYIASRDNRGWTGNGSVEFALLGYQPEPWQPSDSLAAGLNMFKLLASRWRRELARLRIEEQLPDEFSRDLFVTHSEYDHPVALPLALERHGRRPRRVLASGCGHPLHDILGTAGPVEVQGASNNWVVAGRYTASGKPMLANDMHLPHTVPAVWFINHLVAPGLDVRGFSLPGLPFVIAGHNQHIAWGFTNLGADVQDLYVEHFDPDNPANYLTPNGWQPVIRRKEEIRIRGGRAEVLEVLETRNGPVVHDDGGTKFALRWTALDAGQISLPFLRINQATNWDEFREAMSEYGGPAQNAVYADSDGHIGYQAVGRVPLRRVEMGQLPVPGDSDDFAWEGYVPFDRMPENFDPPEGFLATANNRVTPLGYPVYITDQWMNPSRVHRIYLFLIETVEQGKALTPPDLLALQGDTLSLPNQVVAQTVVRSAASADTAGDLGALQLLREWDGRMERDSAAAVVADALRMRLMQALLQPQLGDDWQSYNWWMAPVFLENVLSERPQRWLPPGFSNWDEFLMSTLADTVRDLLVESRTDSVSELRWGDRVAVQMRHPLGDHLPLVSGWFSPPVTPQSGGRYSVKQTTSRVGPSERLVVDFADLDNSLLHITLGQSGHVLSPHYRDQFLPWLEVRETRGPYSEEKVRDAAVHLLNLTPAD